MNYLAHSAKDDCPEQTYKQHVTNVYNLAEKFAKEAERFANNTEGQLENVVCQAAEYHDLGKLDDDNQSSLHDAENQNKHLPINHVDAGVAFLKKQNGESMYSALTVYAHHKGLPNYSEEINKENKIFRDEREAIRDRVDGIVDTLEITHNNLFNPPRVHLTEKYNDDLPIFLRMSLSCLADADHTDTAQNYRKYPLNEKFPELRASERLAALDKYVSKFECNDDRNKLRMEMYKNCRDSRQTEAFVSCDSPVGSGKTTSIMAHLLKQAELRGLRRIFVVLPFTNIIEQSVDVYRKALTLPEENPEEVVAELHHRADFESEDLRYLTALWRAPIIVTTAVAFFETLASNRPSSLRRLHELPGSAIFLDESHASLPIHLLSIAWHWIKKLGEEWGCYWVLASGSLVRFWEMPELTQERITIPNLVDCTLHDQLMKYEKNRIRFKYLSEPQSREELLQFIISCPGPRLLIVNTIQSAAVIANDFERYCGREKVEHLSTALTPEDRAHTIERIKFRLKNKKDDDWTLIATSCVEAGVDFSFRTGFRELASLLSLLQTAGRINRNGNVENADVWSFRLQDDMMLKQNTELKNSIDILRIYFENKCQIVPELSTKSIIEESHLNSNKEKLCKSEIALDFKDVAENFNVIESNKVIVVIGKKYADMFKYGNGNWKVLQMHSVSISRYYLNKYGVSELLDGIYYWERSYDTFLGYMKGVLEVDDCSGIIC